jgi:hypothetical protein
MIFAHPDYYIEILFYLVNAFKEVYTKDTE